MKSARQISATGLQLVKHFEAGGETLSAKYLTAYWDKAGECWTIGWGHTGLQHKDGTVKRGRVITVAEAKQLLAYDMHQFEQRVLSLIDAPLNDDQFAALVAFDFNCAGLTWKGKLSTLSRKLNARDYEGAALEFPKWNKADGKVMAGLTRRRLSEQRLFRSQHPAIIPHL